jgi:flagellum-specific ATP synthase
MHNVVSRSHFELARRFRAIYSRYERSRDLVQIGAYAAGSDPGLDEAIALHARMQQFLQQDMYQPSSFEEVINLLVDAMDTDHAQS